MLWNPFQLIDVSSFTIGAMMQTWVPSMDQLWEACNSHKSGWILWQDLKISWNVNELAKSGAKEN